MKYQQFLPPGISVEAVMNTVSRPRSQLKMQAAGKMAFKFQFLYDICDTVPFIAFPAICICLFLYRYKRF